MTTEEYRAHPALNFSLAKALLDSPAHFMAARHNPPEETDAMRFGTLAHAMVLEGKDLTSMYVIKPEGMSFATKEGKAWRAEQTLPIIPSEEAARVHRMAQAVSANPHASALLKSCQHRETPIIGRIAGVECKALLDCHGTDGEQWVICDFKTCMDASPRSFAKDVHNRHYDLQMAWYSALLAHAEGFSDPPYWVWLAAEKNPPFVNVVYTSELWEQSGQDKLMRVLDLYKECTESGQWPMPYRGIQSLPREPWM
jgi:hypothetical protein